MLFSIDIRRLSYFIMFYIQLSWNIPFLTNIDMCSYVVFSNIIVLQQSKKSINFDFWSTTTSADTKLLLTKPSDHWKMEHYWGSDDSGEVDLDSDVNHLASGNFRQYTTVPSHCEQFPRTWTWRLCISIVDIILRYALVLFSMLRASNYHYNKGNCIVNNIMILTIHGGLFRIIFL